jgi:hypothetical protein
MYTINSWLIVFISWKTRSWQKNLKRR